MNIKYLWVIAVVLSTFLFIFQVSVDSINPDGAQLYEYQGSFIQKFDGGNYTLIEDTGEGVPELPAEVATGSDGGFTDIFSSIKNWFTGTKTGGYLTMLFYGVPNLLKSFGMPPVISYALGILWYLMAVFSFIVFLRGLA